MEQHGWTQRINYYKSSLGPHVYSRGISNSIWRGQSCRTCMTPALLSASLANLAVSPTPELCVFRVAPSFGVRPGRCSPIPPPQPPPPRPHPPKNRSSSSLREAERPRSLLILLLLRADVTQLPACKFEKTPRRSSQRSRSRAASEPALPCFSLCVLFYFVLFSFQRRGINLCSEWRRAGKKKRNQKNIHASRSGIINKAFKCCVAVS